MNREGAVETRSLPEVVWLFLAKATLKARTSYWPNITRCDEETGPSPTALIGTKKTKKESNARWSLYYYSSTCTRIVRHYPFWVPTRLFSLRWWSSLLSGNKSESKFYTNLDTRFSESNYPYKKGEVWFHWRMVLGGGGGVILFFWLS